MLLFVQIGEGSGRQQLVGRSGKIELEIGSINQEGGVEDNRAAL
jgi:hypothetical protein